MLTPGRTVLQILIAHLLLIGWLISCPQTHGQAPHLLTPADKQKVDSILHQMSLDQKLDYIGGTGFAIRALPSLGLPAFEMSDGPFGVRSNEGLPSTTYAAGIGLAASWDRDLAARVGAGIGRDARARGIHFMLGPGVNIYRSARNGRNFEYFGEDPFLASAIAVGYIKGMQQQGVSATVKHFLGNNSELNRSQSNSVIDERTAREIYLPAFEAAVKFAHVGAIMDGYNLINGSHDTESNYFNIDVLRHDWGFQGIVMSDWGATHDAAAAAKGGLDLEMPDGKYMNPSTLAGSVRSDALPESIIDDKVRHILSTAVSFDWLGRPQRDASISLVDASNTTIALESARESIVLLKNDAGLLPLDRNKIKTILVVGPDAYPGVPVGGGSAGVVPFVSVSPLEGLITAAGSSVKVLYDRGLPSLSEAARATKFTVTELGDEPGLTAESFKDEAFAGQTLASKVVQYIDGNGAEWSALDDEPLASTGLLASRGARVVRRFTGFYTVPAKGKFIVVLQAGGEGSRDRVYVDGQLLINNWNQIRAYQPHSTIELSAGRHKVVVEDSYYALAGRLSLAIVDTNHVVSASAVQLATGADVVVVAAGFDHQSEAEGGDRTFSLPFAQDELISAMAKANRRTIVDITSGGGFDSAAWIDHVPALLESWYSGEQGGTALAEVLLGDVNPSGHLPVTFERKAEDNPSFSLYYPPRNSTDVLYKEGIFVGYRGYLKTGTKPLFPFGYGLSYTTYKFSNLVVDAHSAGANPKINVSFTVTNTGARAGAEIAQIYVSEVHPMVPRPERELKGFERIQLAPGQTKRETLTLSSRDFAFFDVDRKGWAINPGKFTIYVGDSIESLPLEGSVGLDNEVRNTTF